MSIDYLKKYQKTVWLYNIIQEIIDNFLIESIIEKLHDQIILFFYVENSAIFFGFTCPLLDTRNYWGQKKFYNRK